MKFSAAIHLIILSVAVTSDCRAASLHIGQHGMNERKPFFTEIYRQAIFVQASHVYGLAVKDAALLPPDLVTSDCHLYTRILDKELSLEFNCRGQAPVQEKVPFPGDNWDIIAEVRKAQDLASRLLGKFFMPPDDRPEPDAELLRSANRGFERLDPFSLIWALNKTSAALKGRAVRPPVLRKMAIGYGWLGKLIEPLLNNKSKVYHARALACAALADRLSGGASSATAFALNTSGRPADALFVLLTSTPDALETVSFVKAWARQDISIVDSWLKRRDTAAWRYLQNAIWDNAGMPAKTHDGTKARIEHNPADFNTFHFLVRDSDVTENHELTVRYLNMVMSWRPFLELVGGTLPAGPPLDVSSENEPDPSGFLEGLKALRGPEDAEEIPLFARVQLAKDVAFDAVYYRMRFLSIMYGDDEAMLKTFARYPAIIDEHPWGFLARTVAKDEQAGRWLMTRLFAQPATYTGLRATMEFVDEAQFGSMALPVMAPRLDDVRYDVLVRMMLNNNPKGKLEAARRAVALNPAESLAYLMMAALQNDPGILLDEIKRNPSNLTLLRGVPRFAAKTNGKDARTRFLPLLRRLIELDPTNWDARQSLAHIAVAAKDDPGAIRIWEEYLKQDSRSLQAVVAMEETASSLLRLGRRKEALRIAQSAASSYKQSAMTLLAYIWELEGDFGQAEAIHQAAAARYPTTSTMGLAGYYLRTGKPQWSGVLMPLLIKTGSISGLGVGSWAEILQARLLAADWKGADELLSREWKTGGADLEAGALLWWVVCRLRNGLDIETAVSPLKDLAPKLSPADPLQPVIRLYMGAEAVADVVAELPSEPGYRSRALFFVAQQLKYRGDETQARRYLKEVQETFRWDAPEFTLASLELKPAQRQPTTPEVK